MSPKMPFGKYKGQRLSDIDTGYLGIVFDNSVKWGVSPELRAAIVAEMLHRIAPGARRVRDDEPRPTEKQKVFDPHGVFDQAGPSAYEPRPTPIRTNTSEMPRMLREIIDTGFKQLARKYHPDVSGGNHESMSLLNRAAEALRKALPK